MLQGILKKMINTKTVYSYSKEASYNADPDLFAYSSRFPESIKIISSDTFYKVEFYIRNNRIESWIGFRKNKK